jgi:hypothetical protein
MFITFYQFYWYNNMAKNHQYLVYPNRYLSPLTEFCSTTKSVFSAMMNSAPNMNRTSTCHDSANNTVLPEPFTLLSPHTDSSVRAMKQKPGLIGVDYMAPMS